MPHSLRHMVDSMCKTDFHLGSCPEKRNFRRHYRTEPLMNAEQLQRLHYDTIASDYTAQYGDDCSQQYRRRFINDPMFAELELSGLNVLEAMSGSGQTTEYLLSKGARVTGLDISPEEIASFRSRWPGCDVRCASILDSGLAADSFDCVAIVGGLHHVHPHVNEAIREIHRILKPGGSFCFAEPHHGSIPDIVREFWYKHDRLFAANEASIDVNSLKQEFSSQFTFVKERYLGNIAYLLVLNSMVFRIPARVKPWYTPLVMAGEAALTRLQGKRFSCFVTSQWLKR